MICFSIMKRKLGMKVEDGGSELEAGGGEDSIWKERIDVLQVVGCSTTQHRPAGLAGQATMNYG